MSTDQEIADSVAAHEAFGLVLFELADMKIRLLKLEGKWGKPVPVPPAMPIPKDQTWVRWREGHVFWVCEECRLAIDEIPSIDGPSSPAAAVYHIRALDDGRPCTGQVFCRTVVTAAKEK